MPNVLTMKLEQFTPFTSAERTRLDDLLELPRQTYGIADAIFEEGAKVDSVFLIIDGVAARRKTLPNGSRQTMGFLIPGDLCELEVFVLSSMDHDLVAVCSTTCIVIPKSVISGLLTESSTLTRALWWSTMADHAMLRSRIIDQGIRGSYERLAHLFYEMLIRYRIIGLAEDDSFPFPSTQMELSEATGMTAVHVNRTLKKLRSDGLIVLANKRLSVTDPARLKHAARFEPNYLHLERTERDTDVSYRARDLVF